MYLLDLHPNEQRKAISFLIEALPKVSDIKSALEGGAKLKDIHAPPGSIGILRWVVGTCRAYLKEAKPGEGVVTPIKDNMAQVMGVYSQSQSAQQLFRQFTFVLGSPEQERDFRAEIGLAKAQNPQCQTHPTMLVFHGELNTVRGSSSLQNKGSATERWHNILRTGLDFQEIACGRVSLLTRAQASIFLHFGVFKLTHHSRELQ